jgi:tRNA threonylcarbamoyladenosine biosynthesis protein TsaB
MLLGLDTSTACTSVAIADPSGVRAHVEHVGSRDHGAFLAPAIAECLVQAGIGVGDLEGVAVGVGPGLYTGLRVGMATAAALAQARGLPIVGISGLDTLAHGASTDAASARPEPPCDGECDREVVATVDARRGQVFWARYGPAVEGVRERLEGPHVTTREELDAALAGLTTRSGSSPVALRIVGEVGGERVVHPDARDLLVLARPLIAAGGGTAAQLEPLYLRDADMRIGWAERGGVRGGVPGAAS